LESWSLKVGELEYVELGSCRIVLIEEEEEEDNEKKAICRSVEFKKE